MLKTNPKPIDHANPDIISFLDELPLWSAPFGIKLLDKIIPAKNLSVLDIGYGTGFPLIELAMRLGNTCKIYGIDPWETAAARVREKLKIFGIDNIELLPGKAEHIPLEDESIDLISSNNGLNNVEDPALVLSECFRVLKRGGKLIFTMNTNKTMLEFYDIMEKTLSDNDLLESVLRLKQHIYEKRKPLDEVRNLLVKSGFSSIYVEEDNFTYRFSDGTAMFDHFFIRMAFLEAWMKIVPENLQEEIFKEIEKRINILAEKEGFFALSIPFVVIETIK